MKPVKFLGAAKTDLHKEKRYYSNVNPLLGFRFLTAVEETVAAIASNPGAMQVVEFDIRRWPIEGFPHGILYRDTQDAVFILAVFHPKQAPEMWQNR